MENENEDIKNDEMLDPIDDQSQDQDLEDAGNADPESTETPEPQDPKDDATETGTDDEEEEKRLFETAKQKQAAAYQRQREEANKLKSQLAKLNKELQEQGLGYIDKDGRFVHKGQEASAETAEIQNIDSEIARIEKQFDNGEISELRARAEIDALTAEKRELRKAQKAKQDEFKKKAESSLTESSDDVKEVYAKKILSEYPEADKPGSEMYKKMTEIYLKSPQRFPDIGQAGERFENRYLLAVEASLELKAEARRKGAQTVSTPSKPAQQQPRPQSAGLENREGYKPQQAKKVTIADERLAGSLSKENLEKLQRFSESVASRNNFKGVENAVDIEF